MPDLPFTVLLMIALALVFDFLNGFHDSSNIVATIIASRALSGRQALTITAIAEFTGPFLFGVAVATTLGNEVLNDSQLRRRSTQRPRRSLGLTPACLSLAHGSPWVVDSQ